MPTIAVILPPLRLDLLEIATLSISFDGRRHPADHVALPISGTENQGQVMDMVLRSTPAAMIPADHDLTVIVPAYNEESRLPLTLDGLKAYLDDWGLDYRVLVVDDGSVDKTASLTDAYGHRFSTISQPQSGKGAAIRNGMLRATGRVVSFTDADLPYELSGLRSGYHLVHSGQAEVVFGARDMVGTEFKARRRLLRTIATTVFREVVRSLVSREVTDTQCGLKIFSRRAAQTIFSRTTINGFAFDAEVVYLTHHMKLAFRRIPVTLINEYASTLSLSRHALPMLLDVINLRLRAWRGEYDRQPALEGLLPKEKKAA